jgi:C-terminal processing protease CtpA/Prc
MGKVELMRAELNLPSGEIVEIGLKSANGARQATKRLRITGQKYSVARLRLRSTGFLEGDIGYLRIPVMDDRLVEPVVRQMKSFQDTKGLLIDVRDNGGGTYGVMRGIYGFFVQGDAKPKVTNIAAYRLSPSFANNHIEYRPTFRADWPGWNEVEREAIRQAAETFHPEWMLPEAKFSEWHYMLLSRTRSGRGGPSQRVAGGTSDDYFYYDKPVVVLSNAGSFSAADGFVNAFAELPQVTVVGEPSAGGSGATRSFQLPKTRIGVALASMASFRPNGKLFDGNGIEVDVLVKPILEDFTTSSDSVLARAMEVVAEKSR